MKTLHRILPLVVIVLVGCNTNSQNTINVNQLVPFATGFGNPVCIANAGDNRLFVVEQVGNIHIVQPNGTINPQKFLDIHQRVVSGGEEGLLGLAFHPQYSQNGYFYVNYIGIGDSTHISRFSVMPDNPDVADPQSEFKLLTFHQPYTNHNGGNLCFGPDGYLYMGFGDGGSAGDPENRAQNPMVYFGKLLRIDVNQGNPYAIPTTNPYYNNADTLGEIWAMGLRNPWRFSFDRLTGDVWIGDVGQNLIEEIDFQPSTSTGGENYGWRCYEGNQPFNTENCQPSSAFTFPVYTYPHNPECSVTGGFVYRGNSSSSYYGYYFFADYCSDRISTLHNENGSWIMNEFGQYAGNNFSTFGEDSEGRLYVAGLTSGTIYSVVNEPASTQNKLFADAGVIVIQYPGSTKIRVETGFNHNLPMKVTLYDLRGLVCYSSVSQAPDYEFNPGILPEGIYILKLVINGKIISQKLIIGLKAN
jgi:glucose/arabinose dehydrogenase